MDRYALDSLEEQREETPRAQALRVKSSETNENYAGLQEVK